MVVGKMIANFKRMMLLSTDARTNFIGQALRGIEIVKVFAWENAYMKKIKSGQKKSTGRSSALLLGS